MKKLFPLLVLIGSFSFDLHGQSQTHLHVNKVRATMSNNGETFRNGRNPAVEVPFQGEFSPGSIFSTSLWMGGYDEEDQLSVAAFKYSNANNPGYRPGPLPSEQQISPDTNSSFWDSIHVVYGQEILRHIDDGKDGRIDFRQASIFGWPAKGNRFYQNYHDVDLTHVTTPLADFIDLNLNGSYDPDEGEYPFVDGLSASSIPGAIAWCVFNTAYSYENDDNNNPKIEIHQTCWAMSCDTHSLDQAIFAKYRLFNRGEHDFRDFRMGLMMDQQHGDFGDNGFGTDTSRHSVFVYNLDNADIDTIDIYGNKQGIYGGNPPVQTITFLDRNLEGVSYWNHHPLFHFPIPTLDPHVDLQFYRRLNGKWWDNQPMTSHLWGYNPGRTDTTLFAFHGHPSDTSEWSLYQTGLHPYQVPVAINRFGHSNGWFRVQDSFELNIAFALYRDATLDHLAQIDPALETAEGILDFYQKGMTDCMPQPATCDDVWPGDTDANGRSDYLDAVNVFRFRDQTGPVRETNLSFNGTTASDWTSTDPYGVNAKHSDIDGNGRTDQHDVDLLSYYLGNETACHLSEPVNCKKGNDITWSLIRTDSVLQEGQTLSMALVLNTPKAFQGVSLNIKYDSRYLRLDNLSSTLKWDDDSTNNLVFHDHNPSSEQLVIFNDSGQNQTLDAPSGNRVFLLEFDVNDLPDTVGSRTSRIEVCPAMLHYLDRENDTLSTKDLELYFPKTVIVSGNEDYHASDIQLYPNPARLEAFVCSPEFIRSIQIYHSSGQLIHTQAYHSNRVVTLDLSDLPPGAYFVRVNGHHASHTKELIITDDQN